VLGAATVFSDYASVLGARIGSMVLSLASVLLLTRVLTPTGYGTLAFFTVAATLIFTVTSSWTSTAVARYGRERLEATGRTLEVTWGRAAITSPLMLLALVLVPALKLAGALPPEFSWVLVGLTLAYGAVLTVSEHMILMLEAGGRMKLSALGMITQQGAVVISLAFVYAFASVRSPVPIAAIWLVFLSLQSAWLGSTLRRDSLWPPRVDRKLTRKILRFSVPMIAFTVSQYVIRSVDLVVIRAFRSTAAVGVYAVAYQGYTVLQAAATAAPPILTPLFVSLRGANREHLVTRYLERVVPQLTFAAAVASGVAAPLMRWVVPAVFGHPFRGAAVPLVILLVPAVMFFAASLVAPIVVLHERSRPVGVLNAIAAAVNVVLDIVLIGPAGMGISGAAVATTAALAVVLAGYFAVARDCVGARGRFPVEILLPLAVGVTAALLLRGAVGTAAGAAAALFSGLLVQLLARPFAHEDADLIESLDMPPRVKRLALRAIATVAR
jgi:O-antigen/teichoic acid export membrane protein